MATLSSPTIFRDGIMEGRKLLGCAYQEDGGPHDFIMRFTLVLGEAESASHLSITFDSQEYFSWSGYDNTFGDFCFKIGTDPNELQGRSFMTEADNTGWLTMVRSGDKKISIVQLEADVFLFPNTTYYIWLYRLYPDNNRRQGWVGWYDSQIHYANLPVLSGSAAGIVYIDNVSKFEPYLIHIDNGNGWDIYIPYIDTESGWQLYG